MSHPNPSHDRSNEYPEDGKLSFSKRSVKKKVNYTGTHAHSHHKGGLAGALQSLMGTKHYGAKRRARHHDALRKAKGGSIF